MKYLLKTFLIPLLLITTTCFYATIARAHGEKSQAAFMRMRTIHWYDLNWSKEVLAVNDTMTISGKFLVFAGWPETVDKPESAFLNIGIPGPVFIRVGSWIGGQLVPRSVTLELGETYEFKVLLKARRPGDWHVHTMMNVEGGGPIIGPGKWVTITGSMKSFTNPVTTLTGETVELETYNLGNTYFWHAFWYAFGLAWMIYWMRKPLFIPRHIAIEAGKADFLISSTDKKVGLAFLVSSIAIVAFTMQSTNSQYPVTVPLQAGLLRGIKSIEIPTPTVSVKVEDATYRIPGRSMNMTLTVTNNGDSAIRLGEFNTAGIRFLDDKVYVDDTGYPDDLLAPEGLIVSDNSPLAPGQSRTIQVNASDAAWEVYRLADLIYDPDSRFAGLLFFFDESANKQVVMIEAPLIPSFDGGGGGSGGMGSGPGGGGSGPPPSTSILDDSDKEIDKLVLQNMVYKAPDHMQLGAIDTFQVVLGGNKSIDELKQYLENSGQKKGQQVLVYNQMIAKLTGSAFDISPITEERQTVSTKIVTNWQWEVKAKELGIQELHLSLTSPISVNGNDTTVPPTICNYIIYVEVTSLKGIWGFIERYWEYLLAFFTAVGIPLIIYIVKQFTKPDDKGQFTKRTKKSKRHR